MKNNFLNKLNNRKFNGTFRKLDVFENGIDFFSNDYLGFANKSSSIDLSGATGSRLLSGNSNNAAVAEKKIAKFYSSESSLIYTSGYTLNVGLISCLASRHDLILYDENVHASIRDGIRLSQAQSFSFKHNNISDLERQLISNTKSNVFVLIESLYSMTGKFSDLISICELCEKYNAYLIVDEAHSIGAFGDNGKGLCYKYNIHNRVFARVVTFGKAYGLMGAAVLSSEVMIDYLINFSRSFIYTTAMPPSIYKQIEVNVCDSKINELIDRLQLNLKYFRDHFNHDSIISELNSPIQIIQIGDNKKTLSLSNQIFNKGIINKPIFYPTVPKNEECLRLCFHSFNEFSEIDLLIESLKNIND